MPLLWYSVLRLVLFVACWAALVWAGLNPWAAVVGAALVAWGVSYAALRGPRDAAALWLAEQDAKRKGKPQLSARARRDAADEDALVDSADEGAKAHADAAGGPGRVQPPGPSGPDDAGSPHDGLRPDEPAVPDDPGQVGSTQTR